LARNPFTSDWLGGDAESAARPQRGLSFVAGPTDPPLRFATIPELLDETVAVHGARDAAVFMASGRRWSWYDLKSRADEVAAGLLALGLNRGDRVGVWLAACEEWLGVQLGAARMGAIAVSMNPSWDQAALERALGTAQCRALILAPWIGARDTLGLLRELAPELDRPLVEGRLRCERLPRLRHVVLAGEAPAPCAATTFAAMRRLAGPAQRARVQPHCARLDPDDPIVLQFTSGPPLQSRAATLTHYGLANNARAAADAMHLTERDRMCIAGPVHHWFGFGPAVLACVASGTTMVFPGPSFDAQKSLAAIASERCTALHAPPAAFGALLEHPALRASDVTSLRTGILAGGPCPPETVRRIASALHVPELTIAYGKSQAGPLAFQSRADEPLARRAQGVGRVHPHLQAKVIDRDGRIVPVGVEGELCVRGYSVMRGYWDDAAGTCAAIDEAGWLHTGDLASLDADGYCSIAGPISA
jgi:fatty-acyl-CoA synthase